MSQGWIPLWRELFNHWIWRAKPYAKGQAWVDMLLLASYQEHTFLFGSKTINHKIGQFISSISQLAERWGWSRGKVRRFLILLKDEQMADSTTHTQYIDITVLNYEKWRNLAISGGQGGDTVDGQVTDTQRTGNGHPTDTINKGNKGNKGNKERERSLYTNEKRIAKPAKKVPCPDCKDGWQGSPGYGGICPTCHGDKEIEA